VILKPKMILCEQHIHLPIWPYS